MDARLWLAVFLMFFLAPNGNSPRPGARTGAQEQAPAKTDRERFGLRGPVKSYTEDTVLFEGGILSTYTEFRPDGKMRVSRSRNPDGSEWVTTNTYDADGRLTKIVSGKSGDPPAQMFYNYDDQGRLVSVTSSDNKNRTEYHYDEQGRKTEVRTFAPKPPQQGQAGFSGSAWDSAATGFDVPNGGSVVTLYDENGRATELQVRDAEGQVVSRIVRTYNAAGLVVEEKPIVQNPSAALDKLPADLMSQMNEAQKQTMTVLAQGVTGRTTFYAYDAQGRVTLKRETGVIQSVTATSYNEHGDIAEERTTVFSALANGPFSIAENGMIVPEKPGGPTGDVITDSDARFTYRYDEYGNWTEQSVSEAKHADLQPAVRRRTLTYY